MTAAGRLRERVRFERRQETGDGHGTEEGGWVPHYECAAGFIHLQGGEDVVASRLSGVQPIVVTVRACRLVAAVTEAFRIIDVRRGTELAIAAMKPSEDRSAYEFLCRAGVNPG